MLKYLGLSSLVLIMVGCATSTVAPKSDTTIDLNTQWDMEGRAPEWKISINDQRFHGSFPGRYEGRMMKWNVVETDNTIQLTSANQLASIKLTEEKCSVAGMDFTHSASVNINKQTFKGCAKRKS